MAAGKNKNTVSIWFWMFAMLIVAIPCVGWIMIIYWAIAGENESFKNYFRAILAWFLIGVVIWVIIMSLGFWPELQSLVKHWISLIPKTKP